MLLQNVPIPQDIGESDILIQAKADLGHEGDLAVSGHTGAGIDTLIDKISRILKERVGSVGIAMRERHRVAMLRAIGYLEVAEKDLSSELGMTDLIAEELRSAIRAVDSLVGRVDVEQVLDEIFSSFCIGK
jgi:tRNA modification GTPase